MRAGGASAAAWSGSTPVAARVPRKSTTQPSATMPSNAAATAAKRQPAAAAIRPCTPARPPSRCCRRRHAPRRRVPAWQAKTLRLRTGEIGGMEHGVPRSGEHGRGEQGGVAVGPAQRERGERQKRDPGGEDALRSVPNPPRIPPAPDLTPETTKNAVVSVPARVKLRPNSASAREERRDHQVEEMRGACANPTSDITSKSPARLSHRCAVSKPGLFIGPAPPASGALVDESWKTSGRA